MYCGDLDGFPSLLYQKRESGSELEAVSVCTDSARRDTVPSVSSRSLEDDLLAVDPPSAPAPQKKSGCVPKGDNVRRTVQISLMWPQCASPYRRMSPGARVSRRERSGVPLMLISQTCVTF